MDTFDNLCSRLADWISELIQLDDKAGSMKRVAAAVGEGSSAIRSIHQHLELTP